MQPFPVPHRSSLSALSALLLFSTICGCHHKSREAATDGGFADQGESRQNSEESPLSGFWLFYTNSDAPNRDDPKWLFIHAMDDLVEAPGLLGTFDGELFAFESQGLFVHGVLQTPLSAAGYFSAEDRRSPSSRRNGAFQMLRFEPEGFLSVRGTIDGMDIGHESMTAFGIRNGFDRTLTIHTASPDLRLDLQIDSAQLEEGRQSAGTGSDEVRILAVATRNGHRRAVEVSAGVLDVKPSDVDRLIATFDLKLSTGEKISGMFDAGFVDHSWLDSTFGQISAAPTTRDPE